MHRPEQRRCQPVERFHSREHYCVAPRSLSLEENDNAGRAQSNGERRKKAKAGEVCNHEAMACDEPTDREVAQQPGSIRYVVKRMYPAAKTEGDSGRRGNNSTARRALKKPNPRSKSHIYEIMKLRNVNAVDKCTRVMRKRNNKRRNEHLSLENAFSSFSNFSSDYTQVFLQF